MIKAKEALCECIHAFAKMQSIVRAPGDLIADVVVKLVATLQVEAKKAIRVTRSSVCLVPSLPPLLYIAASSVLTGLATITP